MRIIRAEFTIQCLVIISNWKTLKKPNHNYWCFTNSQSIILLISLLALYWFSEQHMKYFANIIYFSTPKKKANKTEGHFQENLSLLSRITVSYCTFGRILPTFPSDAVWFNSGINQMFAKCNYNFWIDDYSVFQDE